MTFIRYTSDTKIHVILKCDTCGYEFEQYTSKVKNINGVHFCPGIGVGQRTNGSECKKIGMARGGAFQLAMQENCLIKYGVKSTWAVPEIREKIKQTNLVHCGYENPLSSPEIRRNIEQTNLERYGVKCVFQLESVRQNCKSPEANKKKYETARKNGTLWISGHENNLYDALCEIFGVDDILRQKHVYKWPIDFYIKSIDTYVQYDSHWHGYNDQGIIRDFDEIRERKNKHDMFIRKRVIDDIIQNVYFVTHSLKLVRYIGTKSGNIDREVLNNLINESMVT